MSKLLAAAACLLVLPCSARASFLFGASAQRDGTTVSHSHPNFSTMLDSAVRLPSRFPAAPGPFTATVTYMGVPSTFTMTQGFDGKTASVRLESAGFEKTFTGASSSEINRKVETFLNSEGSAIAAKFNQAVSDRSAFAITDGNPTSTTASAARSIFFSQGIPPARGSIPPSDRIVAGPSSFAISRGSLQADIAGQTYRGDQLRVDANLGSLRVNDRLRLELPATAEYTNIEDTEIYGLGISLAAPFQVIAPEAGRPFGWKLVPVIGLHSRGSFNAAVAGISWHAGLVNVADWRVSERMTLSLINQVTHHGAVPVELGDYTMDTEIDQTILKNGLSLSARLSSRTRTNLYLIDTRFLKDASVEQYYTAGVLLDFKASQRMSVIAAVESDFADNYRSLFGRLEVTWAW